MKNIILTSIIIIVGINVQAQSSQDSYEHFVGAYSFETTPYWSEFEIVRTNEDAFSLQGFQGMDIKFALKASDDKLTGTLEDRKLVITYNPDKKHYLFDSSTLYASGHGIITVPIQLIFVKALDNPNDKLEKEYGVTAQELVNKVRQNEKWIHEIESLQVFVTDKWIKTPEGIENRKKELLEDFPDTDVNSLKLRDLEPEVNGNLEIAFDKERFYTHQKYEGFEEQMQFWDGCQFISYLKYNASNQEEYLIEAELGNHGDFFFIDLMWPRSESHDFWWANIDEDDLSRKDWYGKTEDFILTGKGDYRGTQCYIVECKPKDFNRTRRWYIGIEDGLLYGNLVYEEGRKFREEWTTSYNKENSDYPFPMNQGYYIFHHGETMEYVVSSWREMNIDKILINEKLPEEWFDTQLKEGVKVADSRFGGFVTYKYKKDMNDAEWNEIYQRAQERAERDQSTRIAQEALAGQKARDFPDQCNWLNTEPLTWENLKGKAVVLQFWGHWCGPCKNYMNMLQSYEPDDKIIIIGIHTPETDMNLIKEELSKYKADGPVCVDIPAENTNTSWGKISSFFNIKGIPSWVVIGPKGNVAGHANNPNTAFTIARNSLE